MKKILLISDTLEKNFNGVVNLIRYLTLNLKNSNIAHQLITTSQFPNFPILPSELCLAFPRKETIEKIIKTYQPNHIHIFTEGTIGLATKQVCDKLKINYTTSFNTRFDYYLKQRYKIPLCLTQKYLSYFHKHSKNIFVPTSSMQQILENNFQHERISVIGRGVDQTIFKCKSPERHVPNQEPLCVYAGRVTKEKNLRDFLNIKSIKRKMIIGDGPLRKQLESQHPDVSFTGFLNHTAMSEHFNKADIFVFPSKTDTFGQVLLEAMVCGLPVAAYPVTGPRDLVQHNITGYLDENLETAIQQCRFLSRKNCINYSRQFSWEAITQQFVSNLVEI